MENDQIEVCRLPAGRDRGRENIRGAAPARPAKAQREWEESLLREDVPNPDILVPERN